MQKVYVLTQPAKINRTTPDDDFQIAYDLDDGDELADSVFFLDLALANSECDRRNQERRDLDLSEAWDYQVKELEMFKDSTHV